MQRNFKSFIEGFLDYTRTVEAPEKFLRWSAISAIAGALERKTWIVFNGTQYVYPNCYIMLIGAPGLAKKSSSSGMAMELLKAQESLRFMSDQVTAASLIEQISQSGNDRQLEINGERFKNSSLYIYSSEAAVTLKEIQGSGSIVELLTSFYDCVPSGWSNKTPWKKATVTGGKTQVFNPCVNMLACSTPDWLVKSIGKDEIRGGFASRIIFVVQNGKPERSVGWLDDEEHKIDLKETRRMLTEDLGMISKMCGKFRAEPGTFGKAFNNLKTKNEKFIAENPGNLFEGYYSRKAWHALKLSQIFAADESNELLVKACHFEKAVEALEALEDDMKQAFGGHGENAKAISLRRLWDTIRGRTHVSKATIVSLSWKDADSRTIEEHIKSLQDMKRIRSENSNGEQLFYIIDDSPLI